MNKEGKERMQYKISLTFVNRERDMLTGERSNWGDIGPWKDEPDFVEYIHEETGYLIRARRHPDYGHVNGYVGVPVNHGAWLFYAGHELPSFVQDAAYCDITLFVSTVGCDEIGFGPTHDGRDWMLIGFDTAHVDDIAPVAMVRGDGPFPEVPSVKSIGEVSGGWGRRGRTYKTFQFVLQHCELMATALSYMGNTDGSKKDAYGGGPK